ncbi:hypothetical protein ACPOLB_10410 [Rubrivivax sp. RP6-9]|uniref:hypothetical protein n=1 Tax=Rubrivivax sp. RP6-9 TaxID=3415750 RepID=UPI003CC63508
MHAATAPLSLHQAWSLGTYRRLDQLQVPAFGPDKAAAMAQAPRVVVQQALHALPWQLPRELLALGEFIAGGASAPAAGLDTATGLAVLLRHLAAPISYQPLNPYPVHRAVPSPRCAWPCSVLVLQRVQQGVQVWRYAQDHHALADVGLLRGADALLGTHTLALLGVARFWSLAERYGDFAPFNTLLEAGMAQSQAQLLARALGWAAEPLEHDPAALRAAAPLLQPLEAVGCALRCTPPAGPLVLPQAALPTAVADHRPAADLLQRFTQLGALAAQGAAVGPAVPLEPPAAQAPAVPAQPAHRQGLLALMRARRSGNDRPGLAPRLAPLLADACAQLLALWRGIAAQRHALPGEASLQPLLLWLHDRPALLDQHGRVQPVPAGPSLAQRLQDAMPSPRVRHTAAAMTCHALWCVDLADAEARHEAAALRRLHLAAGAQAQDFSLAATALGLFARPLRMLREQRLEADLALPGPIAYQVMCGQDRSTDTRWEL